MIKGVRIGGTGQALSYLDTLEVPIIENTPNEEDLKDSMAEAMIKYPAAAGVLVRRHGVYVWGTPSARQSRAPSTLTALDFQTQATTGKRPRRRPRSIQFLLIDAPCDADFWEPALVPRLPVRDCGQDEAGWSARAARNAVTA